MDRVVVTPFDSYSSALRWGQSNASGFFCAVYARGGVKVRGRFARCQLGRVWQSRHE